MKKGRRERIEKGSREGIEKETKRQCEEKEGLRDPPLLEFLDPTLRCSHYSSPQGMTSWSSSIFYKLIECIIKTRRSVEHCTPHADGAWLNELGWSQ